MNTHVCSRPESEKLLRNISLRSTLDFEISLWEYRNRHNLVVFLFDPLDLGDLDLLDKFAERKMEFSDLNAEIVAIANKPSELNTKYLQSTGLPFPILLDKDGIARNKLEQNSGSSVVAVDRYGVVLLQCANLNSSGVVLDEIISELEVAEMQCPECGGNVWKDLD